MDLNTIIYLACGLTALTMFILGGFLFFLLQIATRGAKSVFGNLFGQGDDRKADEEVAARPATPQVASSNTLRERARSLDFAPVPGQQTSFSAQAAQQSAPQNFGPTLGTQPVNTAFTQQNTTPGFTQPQQTNSFAPPPQTNFDQRFGDQLAPPSQAARPARPMTPSLSTPRPMNYANPGQTRPGTQPLQNPGFNTQPPPPQQPTGGTQPLQNPGFNTQPPPQPNPPAQPGLGQPYRPSLSSGSRLGTTNPQGNTAGSNLRRQRRRDSGLRDDYDRVYDDGEGGLGGIMDDFGL